MVFITCRCRIVQLWPHWVCVGFPYMPASSTEFWSFHEACRTLSRCHPVQRTTWYVPTKHESLPVSLATLSRIAAVQQVLPSGENGTKLIVWSNPPPPPQRPFTGRTVFTFRHDLFDNVAALASGPALLGNPYPGSGECCSGNEDDEDSESEGEVEIPGLKNFQVKRCCFYRVGGEPPS